MYETVLLCWRRAWNPPTALSHTIWPGLRARTSLRPILLFNVAPLRALFASKHLANNFAQTITNPRQRSQPKTSPHPAFFQEPQALANNRKPRKLPSEGKGRTFESSRARHVSLSIGFPQKNKYLGRLRL